jgi:hypothetical protein
MSPFNLSLKYDIHHLVEKSLCLFSGKEQHTLIVSVVSVYVRCSVSLSVSFSVCMFVHFDLIVRL